MNLVWLRKILYFLNKYKIIVLLAGFVFYMLFLDEYNVFQYIKLKDEIDNLEQIREDLKRKIAYNQKVYEQLQKDDQSFERFARETYFFHKPNEDVYVIRQLPTGK